MPTYFISDLHLSDQHPNLLQLFTHFVERVLKENDQLYILGDLFEYWIGDDQASETVHKVKLLLSHLKTRKITWYFLAGNRDFLVGPKFLQETHGVLLPEKQCIELNTQAVLLLHGDTLCTNDLAYQAFRAKVNKKWVQQIFLTLPLRWRQKFADCMRERSMQQGKYLTEEIMDVAEKTVLEEFKSHHVNVMIHGHVHRPAIHIYPEGTRYVLADWGKMGNYLRYDEEGFTLSYFGG